MIVDFGERATGKTTRLLDWLEAAPDGDHRVLVSHTSSRAMELLRQAREEGRTVESWQFVGYDEVNERGAMSGVLYGRGGQVVLGLDDLDIVLPSLFQFPIERISISGEEAPR